MPLFDLHALWKELLYDPENPLLFNNGFFVLFFGLFIGLYYAFRNNFKTRRYIFCFFSLYFFYKASGYFVGLVIISAIVDFILSNLIWRQKKKGARTALLIISICFNLGLLFYFKYTDFFISLLNDSFKTGLHPLNLLLPIGISFYTFENLSYTIDVYRGHFEPAKKFSEYLLFLSFFPKLVMGPIVRAHDFVPQINKPYEVNNEAFARGFYLIISGLVKKLVISDYITLNYVDYVFDDPARYTGLENLVAVYAYAIVIYCDFSGYSDIAIGIARWLGFTIPPNFLSPYRSRDVTEFWRRWHISLSSWLRDYLYIPLGGNRHTSVATGIFASVFFSGLTLAVIHLFNVPVWVGLAVSGSVLLLFLLPAIITRKASGVAANMNLLTTMLLGGFWHGANWNFIIWGVLHGVSLAVHKVWMLLTGKAFAKINQRPLYNFIAALLTFHFVCFCWVFFRTADFDPETNDFNKARQMIHQIVYRMDLGIWKEFGMNYWPVLVMIAIAYILHVIPDSFTFKVSRKMQRLPLPAYLLLFFLFVLLYGYFKSAEPVTPIYFKF